jgi:hypothetical protein
MAQISRPFQIAFVAIALFALVWLLALRGHSTSPSESGSSAPSSSSSPAATGGVVHGTAPGVEGLSRAVAKAHGAVTNSQQNAQQLQQRSAQASNEKASSAAGGTTAPEASTPAAKAAPSASSAAASSAPATSSHAVSAAPTHVATPKAVRPKPATPASSSTAPSMQLKVEAELKQGKIVAVLFWNPKATDDRAVGQQLKSVGNKLHASVAVHAALASQVGAFGTIIRGVKVYGTPTVLIINKRGQADTLTGYTDAYAIEQAISEARRAQRH